MKYVIIVEGEPPFYANDKAESLSEFINSIGLLENKFVSIENDAGDKYIINTRYLKKIYKSPLN